MTLEVERFDGELNGLRHEAELLRTENHALRARLSQCTCVAVGLSARGIRTPIDAVVSGLPCALELSADLNELQLDMLHPPNCKSCD